MPEVREWVRSNLYFRAVWSRKNGFWKVYSKVSPSLTAPYQCDCTVILSEGLAATCDQINEGVKNEVRDLLKRLDRPSMALPGSHRDPEGTGVKGRQ